MMLNNHIFTNVLKSEDALGSRVVNVIVQQCAIELPKPLVFLSLNDSSLIHAAEQKHFRLCLGIAKALIAAIHEKNRFLDAESKLCQNLRNKKTKQSTCLVEEKSVEFFSSFTASLVHLKSGLDTLAATFGALFELSGCDTWGSRPSSKQSGGYAGERIRKKIESLQSGPYSSRVSAMLDLFDTGKPLITDMLVFRDKIHKGGVELTGAVYNPSDPTPREVQPVSISMNGKAYTATSVLESWVQETCVFIEYFLVRAIEARGGHGKIPIVLTAESTPSLPKYMWGFLQNDREAFAKSTQDTSG